MAHPLELSYQWRTPVFFSTVGLSICLGVLIGNRAPGWLPVAVTLVLGWAALLGLVWWRTQAYLMVEDGRLRARTGRRMHEVDGSDVLAVRQIRTPHGPSYRLTVRTAAGPSRVTVPTALLVGGASTLFGWVLRWAPQADLDRGCQQTVARLRQLGRID